MHRKQRFRWVLAGIFTAGAGLVAACVGEDVGLVPSTAPEAGAESGEDVSTSRTTDAPASVDGAADAFVPPAGCTGRVPEDAKGIFVHPGGADDPSCGPRAAPCKTITNAIARANTSGRPLVYVGSGTYTETPALLDGVTVEGAWFVAGTDWTPICTNELFSAATIVAPANANKTVVASSGKSGLRLLTVKSKPNGGTSESLYGLFVSGGAQVTLEEVVVDMGEGGKGSDGTKGADGGITSPSCHSLDAGDGGVGAMGEAGAAAPLPTISSQGYSNAGSGVTGASGQLGRNGTAGTNGQSDNSCVTLCGDDGIVACGPLDSEPRSGAKGQSGCGGQSGTGGTGGTSGGASVGVFAWDGKVTILGGTIRSGAGGAGGQGGAGGSGRAGSAGLSGTSTQCFQTCGFVGGVGCTATNSTQLSGGNAGGPGGPGGQGGQGGGGAGGWSYAVVTGGDGGIVTVDGGTLAFGDGGIGGAVGGANGLSGPRYP